ncbi:MAG: AarF/UbiB family protein [Acidobacteriota bacterium]|jgi:predicted unusual protein kinase regulating ubiquinone biosynthesis (AarF/ABC1/UbiB family)
MTARTDPGGAPAAPAAAGETRGADALPGADRDRQPDRRREEPAETAETAPDRRRYRRVRRFFFKISVHVVWWDIVLDRPVLRALRKPALTRWARLAREYRDLAVTNGGVLIKLGQFLATRIDLLPPEVTGELSGLQDRVPPAPFADVARSVEESFGRPLAEVFSSFATEVVGSASLAQAHRARLPSGESVVVKVLRPGIERLVEADLKAIARVIRRLRFFRAVRRQVDLDWLIREFDEVTRKELDLLAEGTNAETFARLFAHRPEILVPTIHWDHSTTRILTMEDVGYVRLADLPAIDAAGVDREEVARLLLRVYLEQFFVVHYVHADPHVGNLFIRPLEPGEGDAEGRGETGIRGRPFQLVFVDFGMVVRVPPRLRESMREYAIGIGTGDAQRIVESYLMGGMLLPGADLDQVERMTQTILDQFGGTLLGQMYEVDLDAYRRVFTHEYRQFLYDAPFQFQADLIFVFRAMGILSGLAARIDPELDPLSEVRPFAMRLILDDWSTRRQRGLEDALILGPRLFELPRRIDRLLFRTENSHLTLRSEPGPKGDRRLGELRRSVHRLGWIVAASALFVAGAVAHYGERMASETAAAGHGFGPDTDLWLLGASAAAVLWAAFGGRRR